MKKKKQCPLNKVSQCTKKQTEAMSIILEDIKDACAELGVA